MCFRAKSYEYSRENVAREGPDSYKPYERIRRTHVNKSFAQNGHLTKRTHGPEK